MSESETIKRRFGGRSARVQAAVFEATLAVLQENGYEATTVAEIARRAGVHETSIYRRWKTREFLLMEALLARTEAAIPIPDTGTLHSDLLQLLFELRTFFQSPLGGAITQLLISSAHVPEAAAAREVFWQRRFSLAATIFERALRRGEILAPVRPDFLTELIIGPLYVRLLVTGQSLDDHFLHQIADFVAARVKLPDPQS